MYYIEKNEKEIVKYKVNLYEERLNDVRDRLIKDYSSIIYITNYYNLNNIDKIETDHIKDYSYNKFKMNFSYYIYPELVILIDMLLNGNVSVLSNIINYKQEKVNLNDINNDNHINLICNNISKGLNIEFNINDLYFYLNDTKNIYINNEDYTFLIDEIISCISFDKLDSIKINDFYKMIDFLGLNNKDIFNSEVSVVKKKKRKK